MDAHRPPNGMFKSAPAHRVSPGLGTAQKNKDRVEKANPITTLPATVRYFIAHGDADRLVPHHQSELLAAALKEVGVPVTLYRQRRIMASVMTADEMRRSSLPGS
jgi:acetyl esterase/lipase